MRVKKKIILIGAAVVALILLVGAYMKWVSPTKIAFFNYQVITLGEINRANEALHVFVDRIHVPFVADGLHLRR